MTPDHNCTQEPIIQDHSLHIQELTTRSEFKEQTIMELKSDVKEIKDNVNKLISQSETQDLEIEKRLDTLESKVELYEKFFEKLNNDKDKRLTHLIAIGGVIVAIGGIIVGTIL